ncbi:MULTISPECIES: hypothetical protein [unclassified Bradyrhizobium]|uniref:hypothetical protein n=1 Tax=unclassified Bradyrhizobium TaxID=2631580 RepID=UPI0024E0E9FD|nr:MULTISPECIES: hypothetical protein [unclassified Bradyrhizobium]
MSINISKVMACVVSAWMAVGTLAWPDGALAADLSGFPSKARVARSLEPLGPHCRRVWRCQGDICQWKTTCWGGCPDRFSCYPLYGAYGPYGGRGYWSAYSYGSLGGYR